MTQEYKQVLLGSLFGDGSLTKNKGNSKRIGVRFQERHSLKQSEYLLWKKQILSQQFSIKTYSDSNSITIYSNISPIFKEYHNKFYPSGKGYKIFSLEMLNQLRPLGLAVWYMDDGTFNKKSYSFSIALDKRNLDIVNIWFRDILKMVGKTYFNCDNNSAKITFNSKDTKRFFRIIHSFTHPTMKYKIKRTKKELEIVRGSRRRLQKKNIDRYRNYSLEYYYRIKKNPEKMERLKKYKDKYYKRPHVKIKKREHNKRYYKKNRNAILQQSKINYRKKLNSLEAN